MSAVDDVGMRVVRHRDAGRCQVTRMKLETAVQASSTGANEFVVRRRVSSEGGLIRYSSSLSTLKKKLSTKIRLVRLIAGRGSPGGRAQQHLERSADIRTQKRRARWRATIQDAATSLRRGTGRDRREARRSARRLLLLLSGCLLFRRCALLGRFR